MREQLSEFNLASPKGLTSAATGVIDLIKRNRGNQDLLRLRARKSKRTG